jgi:glyoxylase-like metal-dependent hydrolase (beta-lactamase superfamily II)
MSQEPADGQYEVLAIRYGTRRTTAAEVFLNYHGYGEPDRALGMDYYFWAARNASRTVLVDAGFSPAGGAARGRTLLADTTASLRAARIDPAAVSLVIATHAHYDHIGGLPALASAEIVMTAQEFGFWTSPMAARQAFAHSAERTEIAYLRELRARRRLRLLPAGTHQVAPGIDVIQVGGHTPGQAIVVVGTAAGRVLLTSDAVHYYEEIERDRPFSIVAELPAMYAAFDTIRELAADGRTRVVAGHDPDVRRRFPDRAGSGDVIRLS